MSLSFQSLVQESVSTGTLPVTNVLTPEKMLFTSAPQRRTRLAGLSTSVLIHIVVLGVMAFLRVSAPPRQSTAEAIHHRYSVRFVQLQMPPEYRRRQPAEGSLVAAQLHGHVRAAAAGNPGVAPRLMSGAGTAQGASPRDMTPREHRQFKLPANVRVQPVKQTLVQMDLPPDVTLKQEIPLPTMLMWTETAAPPMRRRFVAPPVRRKLPKATQSLPAAPALSTPNRELSPAELNVAAVIPTEVPHLVRPPSVASPVSRSGHEPAKEIPQIGASGSAQSSAVNLISLPANPLRSSGVLVLPPANQIAPSDAGVAGSPKGRENGTGTGERAGAAAGRELGVSAGRGQGSAAGANGSSAASSGARGGGAGWTASGASGSGSTAGGNGTAAAGAGWSASGSGISTALRGVTRIDLPKEGTFGVVVLGSASSAPYPESVGALSGKVVYTVYLKVGLRKSWILQYCLSSKTQSTAPGQSAPPVQAPWPFLIMRPDQHSDSDPDYIILHGIVTDAGKFDQLSMVYPDDLEKKQLLMDSLKLWAFRPASRDGVPVAVEVLLIIPRQEE